jgi:tetratricopeptide (TPR) repeat protein
MRDAPSDQPIHTAPAAFRKDLQGRPILQATEEEQGAWITVAVMLNHAIASSDERKVQIIAGAAEIATEVMGAADVEKLFVYDPSYAGAGHAVGAIRLFIERMEEAGALQTAKFALDSLRAVATVTILDSGRLLALRARLAWKMGDIGLAEDIYRQLEWIGRRQIEPELVVRAWIGFYILAHLRGNYPEVRQWSERALTLAQSHDLPRLAAMAHRGLMMTAAMAKDFDRAIVHGWEIYAAAGSNLVANSEALIDLGQLLTETGHFRAAQAAFSAVLATSPPRRMAFPAAGGLAATSAALGDPGTVKRVADEVERQASVAAHFPAAVAALLECAGAVEQIGDHSRAMVLAAAALEMGRECGFKEIVYRAEELLNAVRVPAPVPTAQLSAAANGIVDRVAGLHAGLLPDQLDAMFSYA